MYICTSALIGVTKRFSCSPKVFSVAVHIYNNYNVSNKQRHARIEDRKTHLKS